MERIEDVDKNDQLYLPELPDDVVSMGIHSGLPVKTIYSFKTVCKVWCSLPDDQMFVETHLIRSLQDSTIIVMSYMGDEGLLSFYSVDISETGNMTKLIFTIALEFNHYSMVPSFDGMVCFTSHSGYSKRIYVCNPSIHAISQLSEVDDKAELAGFGFDYSSGTHKVLCALVSTNCMEWYLYTLGSEDDSWRPVGRLPLVQIQPCENAYIHGVIHWIIQGGGHSDPYDILSFDFSDESFCLVPVPKCPSWKLYLKYFEFHQAIHLKVIDGYLRLIATLVLSNLGFWAMGIWILKDYKSYEWTYDISININIFEYIRAHTPVLLDMRNGKAFFSSGKKLYSYDLKSKEINGIYAEDDARSNKYLESNFVESLVLVDCRFWSKAAYSSTTSSQINEANIPTSRRCRDYCRRI